MITDSIGREACAKQGRDLSGTVVCDGVQEMRGIKRQIRRFTED